MKIVVVETRRDHYETLGYFFYLKKRMPNIEITIYARDPSNTWLSFFNDEIASIDIYDIDYIRDGTVEQPLKGDIAYINSIDVSWNGLGKDCIDYYVDYFTSSAFFERVLLQLHMGSNQNANKFNELDAKFLSPFPNENCKRLIMPYCLEHKVDHNLNKQKLRLCIVGGIHKVKQETVKALIESYDITHFSPTESDQKVDGVQYFINVPASKLIKHLQSNADYILLNYTLTDRLSGIVLHAISLGIPLLINKSYSDVLDIPKNCYVEYETPEEIISSNQLNDQKYYDGLKANLNHYRESMEVDCDELFAGKTEIMGELINQPKSGDFHIPLWRKAYFRKLWSSNLPLKMRFDLSKDIFTDREAFVFAAGPSLSQVDIEALRAKLGNSLVICIKQSIDVVDDDCDAMIMNFCNFSGYNWGNINCPVLWTTWNPSQPDLIRDKGARCNVAFEVTDNGKPDEKTLPLTTAGRKYWPNLLKLSDGIAPWGPGLMYEIAIPLALHAGVTHINLVGWDIGTLNQKTDDAFSNEHFYDNKSIEMKTQITNLEIETVASSTKSLRAWLENRGVGLSVISDRSLVDESVKREDKWLKK